MSFINLLVELNLGFTRAITTISSLENVHVGSHFYIIQSVSISMMKIHHIYSHFSCMHGHISIFGSDHVLSMHADAQCVQTCSSCIMCPFMYSISTHSCVYCYFKLQKASLTNEASFRQRSAGWKLNDNEYMQGVRDYVTTEMKTQKSPGWVSALAQGCCLVCLRAIKLALSPRMPIWQEESK